MTCPVCNRATQWHGSEIGRPGTTMSETGCHDGVQMDDDEYAEGWQQGVIYPPCRFNPAACQTCRGTGEAPPQVSTQDDCPDCDGTGWKGGQAQWPVVAQTPAGDGGAP